MDDRGFIAYCRYHNCTPTSLIGGTYWTLAQNERDRWTRVAGTDLENLRGVFMRYDGVTTNHNSLFVPSSDGGSITWWFDEDGNLTEKENAAR